VYIKTYIFKARRYIMEILKEIAIQVIAGLIIKLVYDWLNK
jgi:hypothetical protein